MQYKNFLSPDELSCDKVYDHWANNGWEGQWIIQYPDSQPSHYHSQAHECMIVLSGSATIRFGVADTDQDLEKNTHGTAREDGGVFVEAQPGDAFIIPAGVAHKVYDVPPGNDVTTHKFLTPGGGRSIQAEDPHGALRDVQSKLKGFTMFGGYTIGGVWDANEGGEHEGVFEKVWAVPKPARDPFLGDSQEGLVGQW